MITIRRRREGERYETGLNWQVFNGRNIWMFRLVHFARSGALWVKRGFVFQVQKRRWRLPYIHLYRLVGIRDDAATPAN